MKKLQLEASRKDATTNIPNQFIDHYMIHASGEYVKVYLYLCRMLSAPQLDISLIFIADALEMTEKDVMRALRYWERTNLLSLSYATDKSISGICLHDLADSIDGSQPNQEQAQQEDKKISTQMSDTQVADLLHNQEIKQLLFVAENYLGKVLSQKEVSSFLYLYQTLGMSSELIEYLIEFCVGRQIFEINYMEKVALDWHKKGLTTPKAAKEHSQLFSKEYFTILKTFGITGRKPASPEIKYMDTWISEYGFSIDIIEEACNRTIGKIHEPSFEYAHSILKKWNQAGVKQMEDIQALDHSFQEKKQQHRPLRQTPKNVSFSQFTSRDYDYSQLERQLLES